MMKKTEEKREVMWLASERYVKSNYNNQRRRGVYRTQPNLIHVLALLAYTKLLK